MKTILLACCLIFIAVSPSRADGVESFDCLMAPSLRVNLASQIPGLLDAVLVDRGDHVRRGQVVARLTSEVEAAQVALDRTRAESTADIEAHQARLTLAQRELGRAKELFQRQAGTAQHVDEMQAQADIAERELRMAEQAREVVKLELARSQALLRQREIRSPIDGVVVERVMTAGEYAHQESTILRLASVDPLYVEAFPPARLQPGLRVGLRAAVEPVAPAGTDIRTQISLIDHVMDPASGTFGVRLVVPNPAGALLAGDRCRVRFLTAD